MGPTQAQQTLGAWKTQPVPSYQETVGGEAGWLRSAVQGPTLVLNPSYLSYRWQTPFSPILDYMAVFLWVHGHIPQVSRMYLSLEVLAITAGLAHTHEHVIFM